MLDGSDHPDEEIKRAFIPVEEPDKRDDQERPVLGFAGNIPAAAEGLAGGFRQTRKQVSHYRC